MPTGYTADVGEGKLTEFPAFAMRCARAFGVDAPVPEVFEPHTSYHDSEILSATVRLAELNEMTLEEADVAAKAAYAADCKERDKYLADRRTENERYRRMLEKVRAWEPPTKDHVGLKDFMIEQLTVSMDDGKYWREVSLLPGSLWLAKEREKAQQNLNYHVQARAEEVKRTAERNSWVASLRASIGEPA